MQSESCVQQRVVPAQFPGPDGSPLAQDGVEREVDLVRAVLDDRAILHGVHLRSGGGPGC